MYTMYIMYIGFFVHVCAKILDINIQLVPDQYMRHLAEHPNWSDMSGQRHSVCPSGKYLSTGNRVFTCSY